MANDRLYLKVPQINELEYRIKLLSDAATMAYNKGYGVNGTGCYYISNKEAEDWYRDWFSVPGNYYAYIAKCDDNTLIGEVNIHYNENNRTNMIGIVIEAKHRGNGYSEEALCLLAEKAFYELGLEKIADDFPPNRMTAEKVFKKVGFVRKSDCFLVLDKADYDKATRKSILPFWDKTYRDLTVSTFSKGPTRDVGEFYINFEETSTILDAGCGEGRNAIFLAGKGHKIDAFDISQAGIVKAKRIAEEKQVKVDFTVQDLALFEFSKKYDVILSHGVLHLPEKKIRNRFIYNSKENTKSGGYNIIGIFTNRLPATPDNAPFTKSLFNVGELPAMYNDWDIICHEESTFSDEHPGGIRHEHAFERIIARKR